MGGNRLRSVVVSQCPVSVLEKTCAYILWAHAVQKQDLDESDEGRGSVDVEQAERLEPAFRHDVLEGVLPGVAASAGVVTFTEEGSHGIIIAAFGTMAMTVGHQDTPVVQGVQQGKHMRDGVEQAEVETLARVRALGGRRHESQDNRLPTTIIAVNVRPVHVGDCPGLLQTLA